jgi:hypothetical protein
MATKKRYTQASPETVQKHVEILTKLSKQKRFGGFVPSAKWLNDNGHFRSYEVMMNFPSAFKHLKRATAR